MTSTGPTNPIAAAITAQPPTPLISSEALKELEHINDLKAEDLDQKTLHTNLQNTDQNKKEKTILEAGYDNLLKYLPIGGAVVSSMFHLWACVYHLIHPKHNTRDGADTLALNVSKVALVGNCLLQTLEAIKKNRFLEAFSRFIEPLFIVAENRVEDLGLARGIGLGISQLVGSQEGIFNELAKQKLGIDVTAKDGAKPTMGQDFDLNMTAMKKIFKENLLGGLGNQRRFLTGFTPTNIQTKVKEFLAQFNLTSIKELFDTKHGDYRDRFEAFLKASGLSHIKELFSGDKTRDKGHTDALSGYLMILGSLLGYMDKAGKGFFYKLGGTMRNTGGAVADVSLFAHEDPDPNISAMFLSVNTVMDMLQRFIPSKMLNLILPWSNFSMAAYNIGVAIYLNRSAKKTNEGEKIKYHDTDLAAKSNPVKLAQPVPLAQGPKLAVNSPTETGSPETQKQYATVA